MLSNAAQVFALVTLFISAASSQTIGGKCTGQTCYLASLAGSTPEPYKLQNGKKPTGGNASGDRCIKSYYTKLGLPPPAGLKKFRGMTRSLEEKAEALATSLHEKRQGACKPNVLLFARGTTEVGDLGITVGPALSSGLKGWGDVQGVSGYDASLAGIYCIGMPGGWLAKEQINKLNARCPNTKIVLSGYSQGAMVVRIGAALASPAAQKQIYGIALFGDPFNGAEVKGIPKSKVRTWCNDGDGVCKGTLSISGAHLSYVGTDTTQAIAWIKAQVNKQER